MSKVDVREPCHLPQAEARQRIDKIVSNMHEQFGTQGEWSGDCYRFSRSGLNGRVTVDPDSVRIEIELGLLMTPLKPMIEQEIRRKFKQHLS
ncbi:polyhydroxyalkanoic acid system family protein [Frateuria aurantia]|uniref:Putative polyhydroxyalkanoic acid system protein n=1 Tax=Frateuria aurantia (strain ATCC 33424 / DSM 6220 / KCTC 2777 / LMG 1558 / NBRC 3245 / NCIMB 13370) TaxID=767434 RepID=H8L4H4_FRAAD|nr:polyhydroxyalkanoic acid system family protein [Frateuria aurantia]AFC85648.1 putative polyhydroxyalkanoic acid system protein [Frateuria aurantia DSM 6220]